MEDFKSRINIRGQVFFFFFFQVKGSNVGQNMEHNLCYLLFRNFFVIFCFLSLGLLFS